MPSPTRSPHRRIAPLLAFLSACTSPTAESSTDTTTEVTSTGETSSSTTATTSTTTPSTSTTTPTTSTTENPTTTSTATTATGGPECDEDLLCEELEGEDIVGCLHDCGICTPTGTCVESKETPYACPEDCAPTGCDHDGEIDALSEQCDDGNMEDEDGCTNACALNVCGDGVLYPVEAGGAEECDDGNAVGGDGCSAGCLLEARKVFVSSGEYKGNLGGLAGADEKCQTLAGVAKLTENGEQYRAWLSDGVMSATEWLGLQGFKGPFELVDGTVVAQGWADLTDGDLQHAIDLNEYGNYKSTTVWTNTAKDGTSASVNHCNGWINNTDSYTGLIGSSSAADTKWTDFETAIACNSSLSLYCIQVQ